MSSLLRLPNELLSMIAEDCMPMSFESFGLACKRTHHATAPHRRLHRRLKRRFRDFDYSKTNHPRKRNALWLIKKIAEEPRRAEYIIEADLFLDTTLDHQPSYVNSNSNLEFLVPVLRLMQSSPYLVEAGIDASWLFESVTTNFTSHAGLRLSTAFLLTLLPNVEHLRLPQQWLPRFDGDEVEPIILDPRMQTSTDILLNMIATKANAHADRCISLSKLLKVSPLDGWREIPFWNISVSYPFLRLHGLREFGVSSCQGPEYNHDANRDLSHQIESIVSYDLGLGLEVLSLPAVDTDDETLERLLSKMVHLRSLVYSAADEDHDDPIPSCLWHPALTLDAIGRATGTHLRRLSFGHSQFHCLAFASGTWSMVNFEQLTELDLDIEIFWATACNSGAVTNDSGEQLLNGYSLSSRECFRRIPKLKGFLPRSIQKVGLYNCSGWEDARVGVNLALLLQDIGDKVHERLPNLEVIEIRHCCNQLASHARIIQDALQWLGVPWEMSLGGLCSSVRVDCDGCSPGDSENAPE